MKCCDTDRFDELTTRCQALIGEIAARPKTATLYEELISAPLYKFVDVCDTCRISKAVELFQVLRERYNRRFIFRHDSPYVEHIGGLYFGPCEGYRPHLRPKTLEPVRKPYKSWKVTNWVKRAYAKFAYRFVRKTE